jgi:glycosyltransferase involved in cell wall biosynthesis
VSDAAPLVSVVVPAYNAARTLPETVQSVLDQSMRDIEVIVVDDGSTDETLETARAIDDPRVTVLPQPNGGVSAARNNGARAARGRYVAFLDSDDLWLPHKLERQLEILEREPDVHAVQAGVVFVDDGLQPLSVRPCADWEDPLLDTLYFRNLPAFPSTVIITREKLLERGGFDTSLVILEDWELAVHAAWHWDLRSVHEPLGLYRFHPGNRSRDVSIHVEPGERVLARIFADPELPEHVRRKKRSVYARLYLMLAGGSLRARDWRGCARWGARAVARDPTTLGHVLALPLRRLSRRLSRRRADGYAG